MARAIAVGILLGGAVALPMPARAVSASIWTGAASDDWADAGNWVVPPTAGSFVLIDALSPHAAHLRGAASVGAMTVGGDGQGELVIESGGVLEVLGSQPAADPYSSSLGLVVGDARGSEGTVRVEGDGVLVAENNTLIGNGGTGNLSITGGGTAELGLNSAFSETVVGFGYYGWGDVGDGVGHVTVDGAGSSLTYAGGLNVLNGTVDVTNGGRLEGVVRASDGGTFWVDAIGFGLPAYGSSAGLDGEATVTVSGDGSAWNSVSALNLGWGGDGTLAILDGGAASFTGFANLGVEATLFDETGHSTGQTRAGTGALLVSGEGSSFTLVPLGDDSSNGDLRIGYEGASSARIDSGASASIAGVLIVGDGAAGTLDIATGGTTAVGGSDSNGMGLIVGNVAGSSGAVAVTGAGSFLEVAAGAQIGNAGTGSLAVTNGADASIGLDHAYSEIVMGLGYYGWGTDVANGRGTLLVDGTGSTLAYSGGLNVLAGTVTVSNGGQLDSFHRVADGEATWLDVIGFGVPADPDPEHDFDGLRGTASVTITGKGSKWNSVNALDVGDGGDGKLSVLAGATATFADIVRVGGRAYLYDSPTGSPVPGVDPQAGTGAIVVSGAGSKLTANLRAIVGDRAHSTGSLAITGGGATTVGGSDANGIGFTIGNAAGSTGSVIVDGAGSVLTVDAGAQIGYAGTGSLSVRNGGHADIGLSHGFSEILVGLGYYGWGADTAQGKGDIVVDGAGSLLKYAGGLNVLNGTVSIRDGGQLTSVVRAGEAGWIDTIGFGVPADPVPEHGFGGLRGVAEVVVSGAGSTWASSNNLTIGAGGDGVLRILDGGKASFVGSGDLGAQSYLYDSIGGSPVPDLAPQMGSGELLVSGSGSAFSLVAAAGAPSWGLGDLRVGLQGQGRLTVADGATASVASGITVGGQGSVVVGSASGALGAPGSIATPTIALADAAATLVFRHSATSYDFAPAISGTGEVDVAAGFTKLAGDSSAFAGTTMVDSGATLSVNGSLGGTLGVDGRLQGTGTVGHVTIHDGGTLAPGNSPGTLHVDGDLVMESGSLYDAEIDPDTGASDAVLVGGDVTIQPGTTLSVTNIGGTPLTPGTNLQLIQTVGADSVIDGQFDTVTGSSDFLDLGLTYEDGKIVVAVERSESVTFASAAGAGFEDVGAALDALPDDNALTALLFAQVTSVAQAQATIPDMAGTMHADLRRAMLEASRYPRAAVGERLQDDNAIGGVAWARAMGGSASNDGDDGLPGADVDHSGVMVGYDTTVGGSRLGIAIGTDKGGYEADGKEASADLYSRHVSLYGRSLVGGLRVGYGLAFGATDAKGYRAYDIGSVSQHLYSKHEARTTQGFVDLGYRLDGGNSFRYLEPFLNLARVQVKDDATTEEGGVAALEIASGDTNATFATVGLRWSADMGGADFAGSIGYRHAFGFDGASATQAFAAGGPSFTIGSLPVDNAVVVDLGARFRVSDHARVWFGYDGMLAGSAQDHGLKLQFNLDL